MYNRKLIITFASETGSLEKVITNYVKDGIAKEEVDSLSNAIIASTEYCYFRKNL